LIATGGQTPSQARQNMQSGSLTCNGFFVEAGFPGKSRNSKTSTGQASIQAPSAMQISKSTETNSPQTPIIALSDPTLPQVLSLTLVSATRCSADCPIFDLYSTSIGPGLGPPPFHVWPTLAVAVGSSSFFTSIGFASGTIFAKGYEQVELNVTVEIVTGEVVDIIYQIFPIEKFGDPQWVKDYRKKADHFAKMIIDTILRNTILADKLIESFVKTQKISEKDAIGKLEEMTPLATGSDMFSSFQL